jgi:hypothetical protein
MDHINIKFIFKKKSTLVPNKEFRFQTKPKRNGRGQRSQDWAFRREGMSYWGSPLIGSIKDLLVGIHLLTLPERLKREGIVGVLLMCPTKMLMREKEVSLES